MRPPRIVFVALPVNDGAWIRKMFTQRSSDPMDHEKNSEDLRAKAGRLSDPIRGTRFDHPRERYDGRAAGVRLPSIDPRENDDGSYRGTDQCGQAVGTRRVSTARQLLSDEANRITSDQHRTAEHFARISRALEALDSSPLGDAIDLLFELADKRR